MSRVVDLHGCILPAVLGPQGPQTMAESVKMIKSLSEQGITDIFSNSIYGSEHMECYKLFS